MTLRNIQVLLSANNTQLKQSLAQSETAINAFGRSGSAAGTALKAGLAGGALAAGAGLLYATGKAIAFDKAMRNVNSISKMNEKDLAALGDQVIELSKILPQTATELAEGLYDISSSGFQGAEGMKVLEASAIAASAGMTTTATSAKAITAVLNAYGLGAESAADVSDSLFQTVNLGVLNFEELAGSIGDVVGIAAPLGVEVSELGSAIAVMTKQGVSGSESTTLLTNLFTKMIRPSEALAGKMKELGYESGEAMLAANGLKGTMDLLREATGGNITSLMELFPDIQAARGALSLMANEGRTYTEVSAEIENAEKRQGATSGALAEQMKSVSAQMKLAKNQVDALATSIGMGVLPVLLSLIEQGGKLGGKLKTGIGDVVKALDPTLDNLREILGDVWDILVGLGDAIGPVAGALLKLSVGGVVLTLQALTEVLSVVTGLFANSEEAVGLLAVAIGVQLVASAVAGGLGLVALRGILDTVALRAMYASGAMAAFLASPAGVIVALAALAAGASYLTNKLAEPVPELDRMTSALKRFEDTGRVTGSLLNVVGDDFTRVAEQVRAADLNKWFSMGGESAVGIQSARNELEGLDKSLAAMVQSGNIEGAKEIWEAISKGVDPKTPEDVRKLKERFGEYTGAVDAAEEATRNQAAAVQVQKDELQGVNEVLGAGYTGFENYSKAMLLSEDQTKALGETLGDYADALSGFIDPIGAYTGLLATKEAAEQKTAQATADKTKDQKDSWEDFAGSVSVSVDEYLDELERMVQDQANWATNMLILSSKVSEETLAYLRDLGPEGASLVAKFVNSTDAEMARLEGAVAGQTAGAMAAAAFELAKAGPVLAAVAARDGEKVVEALAAKLAAGKTTVAAIAAEYGVSVTGGIVPPTIAAGSAVDRLKTKLENLDRTEANPTVKLIGLDLALADVGSLSSGLATLARMDISVKGSSNGPAGDGPGRGGPTLAKVSSLMEGLPGLRVSSTYRSPASNAAAGGSPTSYHLDRANPAVDVSGPTSSLDRLAARARGKGGWRELLWRVPDHFDHVHFAAMGGAINGPGSGTSDSIPAWLSNGEHVWTAKEVQGAGGHAGVERIRSQYKFATGGAVRPKSVVMSPTAKGFDLSNAAGSLGSTAAIDALVEAWERYNDQVQLAGRRREIVKQLNDDWTMLKKRGASYSERLSATERVVAGQKQLIEFDKDASRAAERVATATRSVAVAMAERRAANQAEYEFDRMTVPQQIKLLEKRLSGLKRFSDEWMETNDKLTSAVKQRDDDIRQIQEKADADALEAQQKVDDENLRLQEKAADRAAEIAENRAEAELDAMNPQQQVEFLNMRIAAEEAYTDTWVQLVNRRKNATDQIAEAARETERVAKQAAEDAQRVLDEAAKVIEDAAKRIADAARQIQSSLKLDQDIPASWANTTEQLINSASKQIAAMNEYADLMEAALARGLSAANLSDLGVNGVGDLAQLRELVGSSSTDIASLIGLLTSRGDSAVRLATYDSGGWLEPGLTMAYNGTGQREMVSTAAQSSSATPTVVLENHTYVVVDGQVIDHRVERVLGARRTASEIAGVR